MKTLISAAVILSFLPLSGLAAPQTKVCFEAETPASYQPPFQQVRSFDDPRVSGGGYLEIQWETKFKRVGHATFKFQVKTAGVYTLWARTLWMKGCGNSLSATVNRGAEQILGEDGTTGTWHWVGGRARVRLKYGQNTLVLVNREAGVRVDKFCFYSESVSSVPRRKE